MLWWLGIVHLLKNTARFFGCVNFSGKHKRFVSRLAQSICIVKASTGLAFQASVDMQSIPRQSLVHNGQDSP